MSRQTPSGSCFGKVFTGVVIGVVVVGALAVLAASLSYHSEKLRAERQIQEYCSSGPGGRAVVKYDPNPALPPINPAQWSKSLARSLFSICLAVNASNCVEYASDLPPPPGYSFAKRLVIPNPARPSVKEMYGYLFSTEDYSSTILCFTGTVTLSQWLDDIEYTQVPLPVGLRSASTAEEKTAKVHRGFWSVWSGLRPIVMDYLKQHPPTRGLIVTGHSLGGGVSVLAAYDLSVSLHASATAAPITHYSFAAPLVGDPAFASAFSTAVPQSMRVCNLSDIVPMLPPPVIPSLRRGEPALLYQQTPLLVSFNKNMGTIDENHVEAYTEWLASSS